MHIPDNCSRCKKLSCPLKLKEPRIETIDKPLPKMIKVPLPKKKKLLILFQKVM